MEAIGIKLPVGSACTIPLPDGRKIEAEVVGFDGDRLLLMPQSSIEGIVPGTRVFPLEVTEHIPKAGHVDHPRRRAADRARHLPVGIELLGRVLDAAGMPLDDLGPLKTRDMAPLTARQINPLSRAPITEALDVGVRAIHSAWACSPVPASARACCSA